MSSFCILLTSTIKPITQPNLKRSNFEIRLKDYIDSLNFWKQLNIPIVFCDNSDYNLIDLKPKVDLQNNIEYLQMPNNKIKMGKGSGEIQIMKFAFDNSNYIKNSDYIVKVTGRLIVNNISKILKCISSKYIDTFIFSNLSKNLTIADSRCFIFKNEFFFKYMYPLKDLINENSGIYIEHVLAKSTLLAIIDGNNWDLFPLPPIYKGYYGTSNRKYQDSFPYVFNKHLRQLIKKHYFNI